ncbi:MAG TPA: cell division protein FtsL [Candidatus Acidoferrales bacterium]|nr:cell division protein FtsL [Candidatus Acidoferrales bacterium]
MTRSRTSRGTEFHTVKKIDNSRLSRPVAPARLIEMARLIALGGMLAAGALFYAWQHFEYLQLRYRVESLKSERAQAAELNQQLKLEMAGLRAPSRIDAIARQQLRLTAPLAGQVAPLEGPFEPVVAQVRASGVFRGPVSGGRWTAPNP